MPSSKKIRWTIPETLAVASPLEALLAEYLPRFDDRGITGTYLDEFRKLRADLIAAQAGQSKSLSKMTGNTQALALVLQSVRQETNGIRANIRRRFPQRKDLHKAFGAGIANKGFNVDKALAAIDSVVDAVKAYPTESAAARIVQRDLDVLATARTELLNADNRQEGSKGARVVGTAAKNALHADLVARIDEILGLAEMEFSSEPQILELFRRPIPTKKPKKPKVAA